MSLAESLAEAFSHFEVLTLSSADYGRHLSDLLDSQLPLEFEPEGADIAWVTYTGGTTGEPKGVVHTQAAWRRPRRSRSRRWEFPRAPSFFGVLADQSCGRIFGAARASLGWHGVLDAVFLTRGGFRLY